MAEQDALSTFDFSKVTGGGLFVKFTPGESLTLRVLTVDPVVTNESYDDPKTGETIVTTKFSFICYNWTENKAQILKATANTAKQIGALHTDADFGANIRKVDLKITPPAKGVIAKYDIQVLPNPKILGNAEIEECRALNLDEIIKDGERMSFYKPEEEKVIQADEPAVPDTIVDVTDEPINLDDIPF